MGAVRLSANKKFSMCGVLTMGGFPIVLLVI